MADTVLQSGAFRLTAFDEGGVRGSEDHRRLVCIVASGGKLAIWGKDGARKNIDTVLRAGVPCDVECQYRQPNEIHAAEYGHRYWVREDCRLIVETQTQPTKPSPVAPAQQTAGASAMTVGPYFFSRRDEHGRAWVDAHSWLEQASGCFRLNTPSGELVFAAADEMQLARAQAQRRTSGAIASHDSDEGDADSDDDLIALQAQDVADHFDDFRGDGSWALAADDRRSRGRAPSRATFVQLGRSRLIAV